MNSDSLPPNPAVLDRILLLQSALQAALDEQGLAEIVVHGLGGVPGVSGCLECHAGRISAATAGLTLPDVCRVALETGQTMDHCPRRCPLASSQKNWCQMLQTRNRVYGVLHVQLAEENAFRPYESFIANTGNLVALQLENQLQALEFQALNRNLESQVAARTASLRESEERYRELFEGMSSGVAVYEAVSEGTDFVFKEFNLAAERATQIRREDVLGRPVSEVFPQVKPYGLFEVFQRVWQTGLPRRHPTRFYQDERLAFWAENYVYRLPSGEIVAIFDDITERKRAEEALRESEEKYRLLVENAGEAIVVIQGERIRFVNRKGQELIGYGAAELGDRSFLDFIHPEDRAMVGDRYRGRVRGLVVPPEYTFRVVNRPGEARWIELRVVVIRWEGDAATLNFMADITRRKRAEEEREKLQAQLIQAQKMESVGRLAGGVAHDFNNMLQAILGNAALALIDLPPFSPLRENLEEIQKCAQRSADLTRQLLAFARKQTIVPTVLDLNATVDGMLKLLRRLIGEDIALAWRPAVELWPVKIDPSQLNQVLANLCVNARDSIQEIGRITIETAKVSFDDAWLASHPDFVPGDYVLLAVSDDGFGMDKEVLGHLFEPFFTTKGSGLGTGLGLATVYGIVKQNKGFVNVYSEPGHGTTFKIYLPRHEGKAREIQPEGPAPPAVRGKETILLVEDEPAILRVGQRTLENLGYTVLTASTPGEAIRLATEHAVDIHLLMTDVVMPEMNGRELARRLLSIYPNLKRLFMSGYTANVIAHHGVLDEGIHFLQKPFSTQDLADKVRQTLDEGGNSR